MFILVDASGNKLVFQNNNPSLIQLVQEYIWLTEETLVDQEKDEPNNTYKDGIISVHFWVNYRKSRIIPRNIPSSSRDLKAVPEEYESEMLPNQEWKY